MNIACSPVVLNYRLVTENNQENPVSNLLYSRKFDLEKETADGAAASSPQIHTDN
jgi:hypothetical protein